MSEIRFFVSGRPQTAGSKRPVAGKRKDGTIFARSVEGNTREAEERKRSWRGDVRDAANEAKERARPYGEMPTWPTDKALDATFVAVCKRPGAHLRTGKHDGELKDWAPLMRPVTRPDVSKLVRSAEDALTGVLWIDDAQIVAQRADKAYGDQVGLDPRAEGLIVVVRPAGPYDGPRADSV